MIQNISASAIYSTLGNNSSLVPMAIKDIANSCGLTTASYIAGDKLEGKDRFIDEFGTQAIWLWGIPAYKFLLDKVIFKNAKLDSQVDVRILKNKEILKAAKDLAPNKSIQKSIENVAKNQNKFKQLTMAKFIISTGMTALTYFGLTKFRHKYTENQIKKEYLKKQENKQNNFNKQIAYSPAFEAVHNKKQAQVSFTGGIQNFMFDPVKNMMLVDGAITGERLAHSRNPQDFMGYAIKEGSFWLFMYGAGKMISNALEKHSEKKYNKSIDLDARVIENEKLKEAFKNNSIKDFINEFKKADKSDVDIYKFAVKKQNNLVIEMAKLSDIISILENTNKVDTRKYIDLKNLRGINSKLEKLYKQYMSSGQDIETFFKQTRKLKRASVITNIGSCIAALGILSPAIMLLERKFSKNPEYQVKKDIEAKLSKQI